MPIEVKDNISKKYDIAIIGGGIVGLATAYRLLTLKPNLELVILEKENHVAAHQTGHNSGVIHSGLYYKPGSLKAVNCINGYKMLLEFCDDNDIPYDLCGKIVVATSKEELPQLDVLYERGKQNGLTGIIRLDESQIKEREPNCSGISGLFVPQTGIISYKKVCQVLSEKIKNTGGSLVFNYNVNKIELKGKYGVIKSEKGEVKASLIINCAGLYSDKVAEFNESNLDIRIVPFRGEYYMIKAEKQYLVKNLIYPVPDPNFPFLGVHFTRMIEGSVEAGPNAVFAFKREGYKKTDIDFGDLWNSLSWPGFRKIALKYWKTGVGEYYRSYSKSAFTKALQKLVPDIKKEDLIPAGSGVRAQACDRNGLLDDFKIVEKEGIMNILNAPSPAATSSLSIGQTVGELAISRLDRTSNAHLPRTSSI
ncbi:L-2-hydroxyglutarate dehydrogenase [Candidatus Methylobacter favarea]|uniref:L-2-hydroxyglutarate dehydrogenase n=1 Tax=Candidatus Methylobacter favarea TaxID=2707345 RepID=A0A8S0XLA8_9GAMM|nr:L-2-hydroxyglutarate oxidase [Candidatus Methylobacter favarea]CAA9892682.1 L-2-hydroxyglutarate dehydrogenase [Candidatus Methylobacter favarea]